MKVKFLLEKNFWQAVATLIGYTIGAGILGIPYVISKVGFWPGLALMGALGLAAILVNLMVAQIMQRTRFKHQLVGLIKKYLGNRAKLLQLFSLLVGSYGAITAYLIGSGQLLSALFGQSTATQLYFGLIFLAIGTVILLFGLKLIKVVSLWLIMGLLFVAVIIGAFCLPEIRVQNLLAMDLTKFFAPYGVLLFAYGGTGAIFSIKEILAREPKKVAPAILVGGLIVMIVYVFFALAVVGVTGDQTTEIATLGLKNHLGDKVVFLGNLFAFLAIATSFFTVSLSLQQMYRYDYKFPITRSWLAVLIIPLVIYLFVSRDFIKVIGLAGSLTYGLSGALIVVAYWKSRKLSDQPAAFRFPKFKYLGYLLIAMFIFGIIYTVVTFE